MQFILRVIAGFALFSLAACSGAAGADGNDGINGTNGKDGSSCHVSMMPEGTGYYLICGADTAMVKNGVDGSAAAKGEDGKNGVSCSAKDTTGGVTITCGENSYFVRDGQDGAKGDSGATGAAGVSCTAKDTTGGVWIECGDNRYLVKDGEDASGCALSDAGDGLHFNIVCGNDTALVDKIPCSGVWNPDSQFCDDRDGRIYRYVTIGTQTWMAENLAYETEGSRCYNDSAANCEIRGRIYTWTDAMDLSEAFDTESAQSRLGAINKGICPRGWHVPDTTEWRTLTAYVGTGSAAKLMDSTDVWGEHKGTDSFGFGAVPISVDRALWWTSVEHGASVGEFWWLGSDDGSNWPAEAKRGWFNKLQRISVRCVRD